MKPNEEREGNPMREEVTKKKIVTQWEKKQRKEEWNPMKPNREESMLLGFLPK